MNYKKILKTSVLSLAAVMCFNMFSVTSFAYNEHTAIMTPVKVVTSVGTKAFYKIEGNTVIYSDIDDGDGWSAVPSAYIKNSPYNEDNTDYGAYVVNEAEVVFVDLSECNNKGNGVYEYYHGTKDGATVSSDVDTATNAKPSMGTYFYMHIENGIDPDGPSKEEVVSGSTADSRVSYEITVKTKSSYQLNATVPLYVCMYGYRGTGSVVTPSQEAYKIENYSTINKAANASIVDIVKLTKFTQIYDEKHSNENLAAIAYNTQTGEYKWWYSMPDSPELGENWIYNANISSEKLNASGECYVIYVDDTWHFKTSGVLDSDTFRETVSQVDVNFPLENEFVYDGWDFNTTTPAVGDMGTKDTSSEGLAIKVTELQAVPATWKLVPMDTEFYEIKRGELTMNMAPSKASSDASAVDLAKCSAPVDITDKGWLLNAPEMQQDGQSVSIPTELPIITSAQMAGGNVNPSGCTSVVRVIYTVTPVFNENDSQTNTTVSDSIESNR